MILSQTSRKGPALAGALFLSGCGERRALHDTFFVVTQPLELATGFLLLTILVLAAWWIVLRLSQPQPRRLFLVSMVCLAGGLFLAALPTLMLMTGIVWPSLVVIFQLATIGGSIAGLVALLTVALLVWRLVAVLVERL